MSIIGVVLILLFLGFVLWIIQTAPIPINAWIRMVIMGFIIFAALIWILNLLGINTGINIRP